MKYTIRVDVHHTYAQQSGKVNLCRQQIWRLPRAQPQVKVYAYL